jgi:shikimate kinase
MDDQRSIVLVGPMGAGKTSVGRRLAARLKLAFTDVDEELEASAGLAVATIFSSCGEAQFRAGERRVIERLVNGSRQVIATGGGAFVDSATRDLLKERCLTIWLDAPPAILERRVGTGKSRPLLADGAILEMLERLDAERRQFYREAEIRIDTALGKPDEVVEEIVVRLGEGIEGR